MKLSLCTALLSAFVFITPAQSADIKLTTEDYAPFNYKDGDNIVGLGADQVFEIMKRAGISYEVEMGQWTRAIGLAERETNYCVFTTAHTDERNDKFQWVEPLTSSKTYLIKKVGSDVNPASLEEAKTFSVGTQSGDYTESLLKNEGFSKIDTAKNYETSIKKLLAGRVDLVPATEDYFQSLKADGVDVEQALVLSTLNFAVACNKATDPELIKKMQTALDSMIADGTQEKILSKYN